MENTTQKQRHGCVTAWLILMIIANAFTGVTYLFLGDAVSANLANPIADSTLIFLGIMSVLNLVFAIMLFKWKKWAFWGFAGTSVVAVGINLSQGLGIANSLLGLAGLAILFGILQIKQGGVSAWDNLE